MMEREKDEREKGNKHKEFRMEWLERMLVRTE
jgi:hypothetical protein